MAGVMNMVIRAFGDDVAWQCYPDGFLTIVRFSDGTAVMARPEHTAEYTLRAQELCYNDSWGMTIEHDLIHCILAQAMGLPYSPSLWSVAHKEPPPAERDIEEWTVIELQRWLNTGEVRRPICWLDECVVTQVGMVVRDVRTLLESLRDGTGN